MSNLGKTGAGFSLPVDEARELLSRELALDIGPGDVTSQNVVEAASRLDCRLVAREPAVLCGVELFTMAFELISKETRCELLAADGDLLEEGAEAARVSGAARDVLAAERTALNAVSHLSGVATLTRRFVDAVRGTEAAILDTRKTLPGLRSLQKYAVRAGGGRNHRMGLHDMVLVKDNHVAASGRTPAELARMASSAASVPVEVEVDSLEQMKEAVDSGADYLLLDNFSTADLTRAVEIARAHECAAGTRPMLEASGSIDLDNVRAVAETGVDRISVGALTHSAPASDFGLDFFFAG